ncbi:hypothetical protein OUZ56_026921 [Daphnia magna]|uniref:Uncharacterized protein n=1 Tax=Daphnia magna TaxID=35525 RepID=A0ABQ9ZN80_9CRUS|nr:hypothetical protein OUZ56_026921 [Daphnia magna]
MRLQINQWILYMQRKAQSISVDFETSQDECQLNGSASAVQAKDSRCDPQATYVMVLKGYESFNF